MSNDDVAGSVSYPSPFDELAVSLAQTASRYIYILSPQLDHEVFDSAELVQALSELARRSRQTEIHILVSDTRALVARGHRLLALARRLPSVVLIRKAGHHPQWKGQTVVIRDRDGFLYKAADVDKDAHYQPDSRAETQPHLELFQELWRYGTEDPELRSMSF